MLIRLAVLLILTISATFVHGRLTYRWGMPAEFEQNDKIVGSVPKKFGAWEFVGDEQTLSAGVITELGVTGYVSRVYSNGTDTVTLLLMSGKTGRLVRHTPNICYASTGNTFLKEPTVATMDVDGRPQEFRVLPIRPSSDMTQDFVVVYGFAHQGNFKSPSNPRFEYHGIPAIEKIQVLCTPEPDKLGEIPEYAKPFIAEICRYLHQSHGKK